MATTVSQDEEEDAGTAPSPPPITQPSFEGQLKLKNFMYTNAETSSSSAVARRSSHLQGTHQRTIPSPSLITPSKATTTSSSSSGGARRSNKRKQTGTPTATTPGPSSGSISSPRKKRAHVPSTYAPPSTYAHLSHLPDAIAPNLLILFCGLNPGVQTARTGHAYAHPSNLFWKLLYSSGITPVPCRADEDRTMPQCYSLGLTNIVSRPSRNGAELSKAEMDDGVATLEDKCRRWRPETICVVGKSIWESVWRVRKGRALKKNEFRYGWQNESENMGVVKAGESDDGQAWQGARVFVATSTSGLAATLRPEEKERIWKELGDWCVNRRKERLEDNSWTGVGDGQSGVGE